MVVQQDYSSSLLAIAAWEAVVAAEVDLAALEEAVLAVAELVEAGKCNPALQQVIRLAQTQLLVQFRNFNICKSFSDQPFTEINLYVVFSMHEEKFSHF